MDAGGPGRPVAVGAGSGADVFAGLALQPASRRIDRSAAGGGRGRGAGGWGGYDVRTQLKWPNDLLKDGRKFGGILIETADAPGSTWAVIGIGLNLVLSDALEAQIGQPVADARWLAQADRNLLLAALLNALSAALDEFDRAGFTPFVEAWNRLHAHDGKAVCLLEGGRVVREGVAVGVDAWGRLLLDTDVGRWAVTAGDVSLRMAEDNRCGES